MLTLGFISIVLRLLEIPLLQVIVGNPNLLEVKVEGYFDESDNYIMEVSTASKTLHQVNFPLIILKNLLIIENLDYKPWKRRKNYA